MWIHQCTYLLGLGNDFGSQAPFDSESGLVGPVLASLFAKIRLIVRRTDFGVTVIPNTFCDS